MLRVLFCFLFAFGVLVVICWSVSPVKDDNKKVAKLKAKIEKIKNEYKDLVKQLTELSDTSLSDNADAKDQQKDILILQTIAKAQQEELDESNIEEQIEIRAMQMLKDSFPEYKKYYEQYKILCDNERLALRNIAEEIEPALRLKTIKLIDGTKLGKLHKSFDVDRDFYFTDINVTAEMLSRDIDTKEEKCYTVTLSDCTCPDFKINKVPACKHMLFLARTLGVLQIHRELHREEFAQIRDEAEKYIIKKAETNGENKTPQKSENKKKTASPSLSNKNKNISSGLRGSEEDM